MGRVGYVKKIINKVLAKFGGEQKRKFNQELAKDNNRNKFDTPLKIVYQHPSGNWNQKLLCVTHTDRILEPEKCKLNYLEMRYNSPNRLPPQDTFESLRSVNHFSPYLGQITIWEFQNNNFANPQLLGHLCPDKYGYKPQFAMWHNKKLWVVGVEVVEVYDAQLSRLAVIRDPWLSGGHTIVPANQGRMLVSCSGSDSVLVLDENSFDVIETFRMPEALYGFNYPLTREDSTIDHYIDNDRQLTHINCAWPWKNGILVSAFIQGAIGWFDEHGNYEELTRGFVGCHGARIEQRTGQIYFCDSCMGTVVFLTSAYKIDYRIDAESAWLHDAQQLDDNIFALSVVDRNQIEIMDTVSRQVLATIPTAEFGGGPQFVYYGQ